MDELTSATVGVVGVGESFGAADRPVLDECNRSEWWIRPVRSAPSRLLPPSRSAVTS